MKAHSPSALPVMHFLDGPKIEAACLLTLTLLLLGSPLYGAHVTLEWDRPLTGAPAVGFVIYWDTTPDGNQFWYDAGDTTSCTIQGLDEGSTYYFCAKSYTFDGVESVCSNQVVYSAGSPPAAYSFPDTDLDGDVDGADLAMFSSLLGTVYNATDLELFVLDFGSNE
jgi:hypothetical protein